MILTNINVELTSKCNKNCWMCGRRKRERDNPDIEYGDMDFALVRKIAKETPYGTVVQLHNNGEPLVYRRFGEAAKLFKHCLTNIVTNGKLLTKKADEVINNLVTIAVSVFENDEEADEQYDILEKFLSIKGNKSPNVILRINGDVDTERYDKFGLQYARRTLHDPMGSFDYRKKPTVPEVGVCLDMLHHLAIDRFGNVSICVRFDPDGLGVLGNINDNTLADLWRSEKRKQWLLKHVCGQREMVPLCSNCEFWGVPTW